MAKLAPWEWPAHQRIQTGTACFGKNGCVRHWPSSIECLLGSRTGRIPIALQASLFLANWEDERIRLHLGQPRLCATPTRHPRCLLASWTMPRCLPCTPWFLKLSAHFGRLLKCLMPWVSSHLSCQANLPACLSCRHPNFVQMPCHFHESTKVHAHRSQLELKATWLNLTPFAPWALQCPVVQ